MHLQRSRAVVDGALAHVLRSSAVLSIPILSALVSVAQGQESLPEIDVGTVVTPDRVEESASRTAASVSVVTPAEIEKRGALGLVDVLRGVPGLDIYGFGGPGAQYSVVLRGSTPNQTLLLIDGVRIGDPSSGGGEADLGGFAILDLERIEVLRGPQSALYGSDAMGGVINIITRKGAGKPRGSVLAEGGTYGTAHTRASVSGGEGDLSYAFAIDALHTDGFPRYGYRIARPLTMANRVTPLPPLPAGDPTNRGGASARIGYRFSEDFSVEGAFNGHDSSIRFDNPSALNPTNVFSPNNHQHASFAQGYLRADLDLFDHRLHNRLTLFGNVTNRDVWVTESCYDLAWRSFDCRLGYRGGRRGLEYQGDLKLGELGLVSFGARNETESLHTSQDPAPLGTFTPTDAAQTTHSGFAQHQFTVLDRFDFTYSGRIDAVDNNSTFATWRATAAYRLEETGTKFRATAGTGARVASLFQRFSQYGDPKLLPERSTGFDVGVDQKLLSGRALLSVSLFDSRYQNLIGYGASSGCTAVQIAAFGGCYYNVGRAEMKGVEFSGEAVIVPDEWRVRGSYTHLAAIDRAKDQTLTLRPRDKGSASVIYTGVPKLELEARVVVTGAVPATDWVYSKRVALASYARVDLFGSYKVDDLFSVFARIENIGDTRYEETNNYGTTARAVYGGVKLTW
jgi:vitamin B12 transporter